MCIEFQHLSGEV